MLKFWTIKFLSYTEIWSTDGESKYIQLAEPKLVDYQEYPELMLVDTKYCVKPWCIKNFFLFEVMN